VPKLAFYDLDGTLVSSNVVSQYLWFARNHPGAGSLWRQLRALTRVPKWLALEKRSRLLFNQVFFREYRGLREDWMRANSLRMCEQILKPATFRGARDLVNSDRAAGFRTILVSGSLDFAIEPFLRDLSFDEAVANRLEFKNGIATGQLLEPVIAGDEKVAAMRRLCAQHNAAPAECRAYSDSFSDLPMLEAVGHPTAANPDKRLRPIAIERGWPILDLK